MRAYMRFMHAVREVDRERLRRVLASFPENGIGIVASVPAADGYDIVGSAIAVIIDGTRCEFAITVAASFGGSGLGTALMNTLIDAARRRGAVEMEGFVLTVNQPMLRLARRLGFDIQPTRTTPRCASAACRSPRLAPSTQAQRPLDSGWRCRTTSATRAVGPIVYAPVGCVLRRPERPEAASSHRRCRQWLGE